MQNYKTYFEAFEVGKHYDRPWVIVNYGANGKTLSLPVLLPAHSDPEINVSKVHFHVDVRFMSDYLIGKWRLASHAKLHSRHSEVEIVMTIAASVRPCDVNEFEVRRSRCVRRMPQSPSHYECLEDQFVSHSLNLKTMVCPHKGIFLGDIEDDGSNTVTCPGHGLRWSFRDGSLVKRCE